MHFVVSGEGQAVVLIHGLFGDLDNLKSLSHELEKTHQVIRVDVPNHGLSEHWQQMDYPLLAEAVIQLLDTLDLSSAHLVGHSMGGKIAMATALLYPERIDSVVAADIAPAAYPPRHQTVFAGLNSLDLVNTTRNSALVHLTEAGIDNATAQFLLKSLRRAEVGFGWKMNLEGLIASYDKLIAWDIDAAPYTKAAFIIRGGDSDYVGAEHKQGILAQFPKVQAKTINGAGHWLHAQKPEIFNRLVAEFVGEQGR
ncbi:alpha/beta hydrolase fold [Shewanella denitrificans OS217]|uniref:Alpha/beta hydrolase fold n=1 Tax=Shewanella denitrificans (strain OS217 / ATCC BAA-1090 / DSM 15013) TaxID=318161 RepID=Q12MQ6_SHEDO|nr:alpha/beta fold hydrolase [Shewanella denitrificans]ABE55270.1 alpha/beta hydrolase fold [Shewanella denitrificans OS217]